MKESIVFQCMFFQSLQEIHGNKEHAEYRGLVESMNQIICATGMDLAFANSMIEKRRLENIDSHNGTKLNAPQIHRLTRTAVTAYRCAVLKLLTGRAFQKTSFLGQALT